MPFFDGAQWNFANLQQFLTGIPSVLLFEPPVQTFGTTQVTSYPNRDFREITFTPYIQDDWKVSSKLTVNVGLRWEFVSNPVDQHNQLFYVPDVATAVSPYWQHVPNAIASNPSYKNFDPRVGFAYSLSNDRKTSIRAGFGMFHQPIGVADISPGYWASFPWALNILPGGIPVIGAHYPVIPTGGFTQPSALPGWDYNASATPYVMQYNLNIQREIAPATVLTVGYVGSRGLHLITGHENNPPLVCSFAQGPGCANPSFANGFAGGYFGFLCTSPAQPGCAQTPPGLVASNRDVNPALGQFPNLTPEAWSRYNSMLVSVNKRFSRNFQGTASYTWSRCIDNGGYLGSFNTNSTGNFTNPYQLNIDKGVCSYDQTHVFKANGVVTLPFHGNALVEGWQISGILAANSGLPFNIADGYDQATGGGSVP
jgi:TonB dependent receptor